MISTRNFRSRFLLVQTLVVLLAMMISGAWAEEGSQPLSFEVYAQSVFADAQWENDGAEQIRILSPEEGVAVSVCLAGGNVASLTAEYPLGQVQDSVRQAIAGLGWLGEEELEAVFGLASESMQEMGEFSACRVVGELREAVSICRTEDAGDMVWQPIHGGERIHDKPRCSGMDVSRMITGEAAQAVGWQDCGHCRKNK